MIVENLRGAGDDRRGQTHIALALDDANSIEAGDGAQVVPHLTDGRRLFVIFWTIGEDMEIGICGQSVAAQAIDR